MLCQITAGKPKPVIKARATRARQHMVIKGLCKRGGE